KPPGRQDGKALHRRPLCKRDLDEPGTCHHQSTASMAATFFLDPVLAAGGGSGLIYALQKSTAPGIAVLVCLFVGSIFSWSVMVTKFRTLRRAKQQRRKFLDSFRADRHPLKLYTERARFSGAPIFSVYRAGCQEL